jgi:hypothetical protein
MQTTKNERLSIAAFISWGLLPDAVQEQIANEIGFKIAQFDNENSECYIRKAKSWYCDGDYQYIADIAFHSHDGKLSESASVELTDLSIEEENMLDMLIEERVIESLRHIYD